MKFNAVNTIQGLVPANDDDYDIKKKLKIGAVYEISVREYRNYEFHKKYFALINCAWEYLSENQVDFFKTAYTFRKTMEVASGHAERVYSIEKREWQDVPKSIAFDKLSQSDFQDLYDRVKTTIFNTALRDIKEDDFMKALINF